MSSSLVRRLTRFFGLKIINYDFPRWHTAEWENLDAIDALLNAAGLTNVVGVWQNSTAYTIGQRLIDADQGSIWICQVNHTSASSGTFEDDRTANPTYWVAFSSLPNWRAAWVTGVGYMAGDIVVVNTYDYYYCIQAHTSGATFAGDASKWTLIFSATAAVTAATTAATNAGNSATAAAGSASSASISATNAATSASNAATSETNAGNSATAAATSATNAGNSATAAANSATQANNVVSTGVTGAIRTDTVQSFTGPQKAQAQTNLGVSTYIQSLLDDANASAARTTLGANGNGGNIFTGASNIGSSIGTAADDAAVRSIISAPAAPNNGAAPGQFVSFNPGPNNGYTLPAGGTWAWQYQLFNSSSQINGIGAGVSAGGTGILAAPPIGSFYAGYLWRIA